ncbi:stage II sporulation protein M [Bacillus spongiae]|uniref:Stage II sporulation protein M n=1 Tax=Bacillus spongiae TaxID=2683610 RepID=A0ABU8HGL3_9BACI
MKRTYIQEWEKFRSFYQWHFIIGFSLLFISSFGSFFLIGQFPFDVNAFFEQLQNKFADIASHDSNMMIMWEIFINNIRASLIIMLIGLIPLVFLPHFMIVTNGLVIGIVMNFIQESGNSIVPMIFLGLLPHGITELIAVVLAASLGSFLSLNIWKIWLDNEKAVSFKESIVMSVKTFVIVIFPLILISAFIESFITSFLLETFAS